MSVTIHQGDILTSTTEAIVNPANSFLNHGGGLAAIIAKAATRQFVPPRDLSVPTKVVEAGGDGPVALIKRMKEKHDRLVRQWETDQRRAGLIATGNALLTRGGAIGRPVIHVVGPIWNGGGFFETDLLGACMDSIGREARRHDIDSVAVPAISCGIFGFPVEAAARILLGAAEFVEDDYGVRTEFWLFEDDIVEAFRRQDADSLFGTR